MLQRSPTYIVALPDEDPIAQLARRLLPAKAAYAVARWKNVLLTLGSFQLSRRRPGLMKAVIRRGVERQLPRGYDIEQHFKPRYNPWDQRMCLVPNGDLFKAIRDGTASVVTDQIETFTETGIRLASGTELEADVVVTATGLNLLALGGMEMAVDGQNIALPETMGYKGMMLSGVPNLAISIGYTNASWTLKCDLTCEYVCRLLNHMDERGYARCTPVNHDPSVTPEPFIDFSAGYVLRSIDKFPKQGSKAPWRLYQNYPRDIVALRHRPLEDGALEFSPAVAPARTSEPIAA
jgi:cation diffusion facilitator CzcD-associated flavoprotein CzcO